jgi:hypothetical protein
VLDAVGRMGGFWYSTVKDRFELPRPVIEKKPANHGVTG